MPGYATASDLGTYSPNLVHPDDVAAYLRAASRLVARATRRAIYPADALTGLPTGALVLAAMRDAVCEQVTAWTLGNVDPTVGTVAGVQTVTKRSTTSGPRNVSEDYATTSATADVRPDQLTPQAMGILGDAALLGGPVYAVRGA